MMKKAAKRCVHLDFHTSPDLKGIGARFTREGFQQALKTGHVESITVFAKCHHGLCYFPTGVGTMHPGLDFDLLGEEIAAAHEIGVRAPVYITAGWSAHDAETHPEWRAKNKDGSFANCNFDDAAAPEAEKPNVSWRHLCLSDGPYCEHIYELTREICRRYSDLDGLFFDICVCAKACWCENCVAGMRAEGLDPDSDRDAEAYYTRKHRDFMRKCAAILHETHPDATIFFNSGGAEPGKPEYHEFQTHFEMEDLPTAWGGYDKLPPRAKFFAGTGKPYLGMTGKFHLDWGEFGGYKPKEALRHEACVMAMNGAGCSVGDHLHPDGEMDAQTYENIGYAFSYLERIEPYVTGEPTATLGVYYSPDPSALLGVSAVLEEEQIGYDFIRDGDFDRFDTVVFPEGSVLKPGEKEKLLSYVDCGGKVLFFADALTENGAFALDCGAVFAGMPEKKCDYLLARPEFDPALPKGPVLCYRPGNRLAVTDGTVLAESLPAYFDRTYGRYCGHKNAPYDKTAPRTPAAVQKENVIYAVHGLAGLYHDYGSLVHRAFFLTLLNRLYTKRPLTTTLGLKGRAALIRQDGRYCLNLTYASPVKSGCAEIIADIPALADVSVSVRLKEKIGKVYLPLKDESLPFTEKDGECTFTLPVFRGHETVLLETE